MNRKKILIVDDNEVILKTLAFKLKASEYDVLTAVDGSQAVGAVRRQRPDLVILDINFPPEVSGVPWDGFQIIQWLRRIEEGRSVPIIVISGGEAAQYKERSLAAGAIAFFEKPVREEELLAAIRQAVGAVPASA